DERAFGPNRARARFNATGGSLRLAGEFVNARRAASASTAQAESRNAVVPLQHRRSGSCPRHMSVSPYSLIL
ncbi:MAG: hypothetical protein ACOC1F_14825, partial [Myxococcota bacterium]